MSRYVLGFMFNDDKTEVVLIRKNRGPNDMIGFLNGVGGKVEEVDGKYGYNAMSREFLEETGVQTDPLIWTHFHDMRVGEHLVSCFEIHMTRLCHKVTTTTDEIVGIYKVEDVLNDKSGLNLYLGVTDLIKMAITPPKRNPYILHLPVMLSIPLDLVKDGYLKRIPGC